MLSTVSSQESEKSPFSGSIEDGSLGNHELKLGILMHKKDSSVTIEIEDNAPGIPGGIKDKILQPFFTIKKGTAGTGAGLSIIHDIKR